MFKSSYANFIILIIIINVKCFPINNNKDKELKFKLLGSESTSNKQESAKKDEKPTAKSDTRCLPTQFTTGGFDFTTGSGGGSGGGFGSGGIPGGGLGGGDFGGGDFGGGDFGGGDLGGDGIGIDQGLPPGEILRRRRIQAARRARARRIRRMRMMQAARRQAIRREMERRRALANNRPKPNVNGGRPMPMPSDANAPMPSDNPPVNTDNIDDIDNVDNTNDSDNSDNNGSDVSDGDVQYDQAGGGDYN